MQLASTEWIGGHVKYTHNAAFGQSALDHTWPNAAKIMGGMCTLEQPPRSVIARKAPATKQSPAIFRGIHFGLVDRLGDCWRWRPAHAKNAPTQKLSLVSFFVQAYRRLLEQREAVWASRNDRP